MRVGLIIFLCTVACARTSTDSKGLADGSESGDASSVDAPRGALTNNDLSAGGLHTCIRNRTTSQIKCWGSSDYGQLGYGNTDRIGNDELPSSMQPVPLGNVFIEATYSGEQHTCAIIDTGAVRCWGRGSSGRLGLGSEENIGDDEHVSQDVDVGIGTAISVATGSFHTCVLINPDGNIRCFGDQGQGQLGYGNAADIGDDEVPATAGNVAVGQGLVATDIAAGGEHTCALFSNGRIKCWGENNKGQLGLGNQIDVGISNTPADHDFVDLGGQVTSISLGDSHSCALMTNGDVRCWGGNLFGQLGIGNTERIGNKGPPKDVRAVELPSPAIAVKAGSLHTCALLETKKLVCWGYNYHGQLGYGHTDHIGNDESPMGYQVDLNGQGVIDFALGAYHTCAIVETGEVYCWGMNNYGQLGYGDINYVGDDEHPWQAGPVSIW